MTTRRFSKAFSLIIAVKKLDYDISFLTRLHGSESGVQTPVLEVQIAFEGKTYHPCPDLIKNGVQTPSNASYNAPKPLIHLGIWKYKSSL